MIVAMALARAARVHNTGVSGGVVVKVVEPEHHKRNGRCAAGVEGVGEGVGWCCSVAEGAMGDRGRTVPGR
jgi:hypothetical protein